MIPKISNPLAKSIRTGEGILIYSADALFVVLGAVKDMSWTKSALYIALTSIAHTVARSGLKASAINAGLGISGGPVPPASAFPSLQPVLNEIDAVTKAIAEVQAKPGTPADQITQGLSPSVIPVSATGGAV